jgi:hypothetical protein
VRKRFGVGKAIPILEGGEFLNGINIHVPESRDFTLELIDYLRKTPIDWVRIHPLPSRRLRDKNRAGVSHIDAIAKFAEAGFNLVLPIEVGIKDNVGVVTGAHLRRFVDDSYSEAFKAVKLIEARLSRFKTRIIYGVENEIDTKEWILQSMPFAGWRETTLGWAELSANRVLKYKRLGYILEGIKEASPNSTTMVNFEADDPIDDWTLTMATLYASQKVFSKLGVLDHSARRRMNNYRIDIMEAIANLPQVDIVGLDNYPNYFSKVPPKGQEIGAKVDEIARATKKPVINVEFGYTGLEPIWKQYTLRGKKKVYPKTTSEYQEEFFRNALGSIENSVSQGTFPWVLFLDPLKNYRPVEENGFSLMRAVGFHRVLEPVAALNFYVNWLERMMSYAEKPEDVGDARNIPFGGRDRTPSRN